MIGIYRRFFEFSGKQKGNFYKSIGISLFYAIFEAIRLPAIAIVLTALINGNVTNQTVWSSFAIMAVSVAGCVFTRYQMTMLQTVGGYGMAADTRIDIGERLKYMPMGYFNDNSIGYITSVTTNTVENLQEVATRVVQMSLQGMLTTFVLALAILIYNWRIGLIVIVAIVVFFLVNSALQKRSKALAPRKNMVDEQLVSAILEYIQGLSVVKSYNLDKDANKKVNEEIKKAEQIYLDMEYAFIPYMCGQGLLLKLFGVLILFAAAAFYLNGTFALVNALLMMISSFMVFSQLETAGNYSSLLRVIDLSVDKVNELFETPVMDVDGKDIQPEHFTIEGRHVDFSYDAKTTAAEGRKILDDVSFTIAEGTMTAVVGPSGGGKTTLCHLMARFWDVDGGAITLGGHDVREYTLDSLLHNFSMVFQNVYLFEDTIENNIKFGKSAATMAEVEAAARKACCHEFIMELPDGYQTVIGEGGATISGGEKQRISIARALLKDAPIIILDEATANVDPENEQQLQLAIEELTRNKTIIMIAHRLKTVRNADQILVVDQGRIAQRGSHEQLMAEGGIYADFIGMREQSIGWKLGGVPVKKP